MKQKKDGFKGIETKKLKKIHYAQIQVIKKREQDGLIEGVKVKFRNPIQFKNDMVKLIDGIFKDAAAVPVGEKEDLLGMRFYIALLYKLPLEELRTQERTVQQELKKRREIERQKLDAGNIEKIAKEEGEKVER
jgi:hypothetical protein